MAATPPAREHRGAMAGAPRVALALAGLLWLVWSQVGLAASVTFDAASNTTADANSVTLSHTVGSGSNRLLLVGIAVGDKGDHISTVTYAGQALTEVAVTPGGAHVPPDEEPNLQVWRLLNPPAGTADVVVTLSSKRKSVVGAVSFFNVDQTTPITATATAAGNSATGSVTVASATDRLVVDFAAFEETAVPMAAAGSQTEHYNDVRTGGGGAWGGSSRKAGAASTTMQWSRTSSSGGKRWAMIALSLKPVPDPEFTVTKTSSVESDPYNGATNPKRIPGAAIRYTVTLTSQATGSPDADTVVTEPVPANTALYVSDLGGTGSGPVAFTDGSPSSGLSYSFSGLGSATDDVAFSSNGGASYGYTPAPDADGYDAGVTHLRVIPQGTFAAAGGGGDPSFQLQFRVRLD